MGGELPLGEGPIHVENAEAVMADAGHLFSLFSCLRLVSPWEQTTAFVWTWMAVMSSAFLAFLAFLDHSAGCELSELRPWSGHGQHKLNGHRAGVSDWSGPQDIPRLRENDLQPVFG